MRREGGAEPGYSHSVLTSIVARQLRPRSSGPRWLRGLLDETFLWVAAGQLLLVLGVRRETVRSLAVLQGILEEYRSARRAAGEEVLVLEEITSLEDLDRLAGAEEGERREIEDLVPAVTLARWIDEGAPVLLDVADGVLAGLAGRRVRPELVGLDSRAAQDLLRGARRALHAEDLPARALEGKEPLRAALERLGAELEQLGGDDRLQAEPIAPALGEAARLVGILRELPPETQRRLIPLRVLRSKAVLAAAVTRWLASLREAGTLSAESGAAAEADRAVQEEARRRAEEEHRRLEEQRRERALRGIAAAPARIALHAAALLVVLAGVAHVVILGLEPDWDPSGSLPRLGTAEVGAILTAHLVCMVLLVPAEQHVDARRVLRPGAERIASRLLGACAGCGLMASLGVVVGLFALAPGARLRGGGPWDPQLGDRVFAPGVAALDPGGLLIAAVLVLSAVGLLLGVLLDRRRRGVAPRSASGAGREDRPPGGSGTRLA